MLAETAARVDDPARFSKPLAIGAARHEQLLRKSLPEADILLEPIGRNSAPPIAAACLMSDPRELLLVLPSDHFISNLQAFHAAIDTGVSAAEAGRLVTFGIEPDHPAIGYGYIEAAGFGPVRPVTKFHEKPKREEAERYLAAGGFYWNAGIFLFRAGDMINAFAEFAPDILNAVTRALTPDGLDREKFSAVRSESIDYAVLERAERIDVVPVAMGWSDLGDFRALHATGIANSETRNIVLHGHVAATETSNAYIRSEGVRVAVHGVDDIAVVATPENILVTRLSDSSSIKQVCESIQFVGLTSFTREQRKWLTDWLWGSVMPAWAELAIDRTHGGFFENLDLDGKPRPDDTRRGRVAPRQLFSFARAKRLNWNPDGVADAVIDAALAFLSGPGRSKNGGWAHGFDPNGRVRDHSRDLYDHSFIALAGSELAALGDKRGSFLAEEAFEIIDTVFVDRESGGWHDPETAPNIKLANPHMHLLEASLAHYEALNDAASHGRIESICILFEQAMFDSKYGSVLEEFNHDWSFFENSRVEPGHCYEWAYLLGEVERLIGRDMASWRRRLIAYAERFGQRGGLVLDQVNSIEESFRLWPQLEKVRIINSAEMFDVESSKFMEKLISKYLKPGPRHGWIDRLDCNFNSCSNRVPASMIYHIMTAIAPLTIRH